MCCSRRISLNVPSLLTVLLWCCGGEEPELELYDDSIRGGAAADIQTYAAIGLTDTGCTASLIAPNAVLTAAHCVCNVAGDSGSVVTVNTMNCRDSARFRVSLNGQWHEAAGTVHVHPDFAVQMSASDAGGRWQSVTADLALILLHDIPAAIARIAPLPIAPETALPSLGDPLTLVGYGANNRAGQAHDCSIYAGLLRQTTIPLYRILNGHRLLFRDELRGSCPGDSGGPVLNTAGEIVGVASTYALARGDSHYEATSPARDWIDQSLHASDLLLLRDTDGDRRAELLSVSTHGDLWLSRSTSTYAFPRYSWQRPQRWCAPGGPLKRQLIVGDFNGDRRTDLLCHASMTGMIWRDLADTRGLFGGTDWNSGLRTWCTGAHRSLYVADFNGDQRDDLLCLDEQTGTWAVDLANVYGQFQSTNWSGTLGDWCRTRSRSLFEQIWDWLGGNDSGRVWRRAFGDFNGDRRADLACLDPVAGRLSVSLNSGTGGFFSRTWMLSTTWCKSATFDVSLRSGKFDGDRYADLLCAASDYRDDSRFAYGSPSGALVPDREHLGPLCGTYRQELVPGDVDGDGRDDLVCRDLLTGDISVTLK